MTYKIVLIHSDEGYSVSCPALPGCASQGQTEEEAIDNIRDAIREYLDLASGLTDEVVVNRDTNQRTEPPYVEVLAR